MSKTVHKLDIPLHSAAFLGISCAEPIHRFSWLLNKQLGVEFAFTDQSPEPIAPFATFQFFDEEFSLHFMLIANRADEKRLAPELKNIDYLLVCVGHDAVKPLARLSARIKNIDGVVGCYSLPADKGVLKRLAALLIK